MDQESSRRRNHIPDRHTNLRFERWRHGARSRRRAKEVRSELHGLFFGSDQRREFRIGESSGRPGRHFLSGKGIRNRHVLSAISPEWRIKRLRCLSGLAAAEHSTRHTQRVRALAERPRLLARKRVSLRQGPPQYLGYWPAPGRRPDSAILQRNSAGWRFATLGGHKPV